MEGAHDIVSEKKGVPVSADARDVWLCKTAWLQIFELSAVLTLFPEVDVGPDTIIGSTTEESQAVEDEAEGCWRQVPDMKTGVILWTDDERLIDLLSHQAMRNVDT